MGAYSNFRGRRIDLTETLAYHLAAVTSLAHLSVAYTSFMMKRQQGILHAENAVGLCFLCLKILIYINKYLFCLRCCGIQNPPCPPHSAVGANMSSEVGTSSEVQISLSLQRWNVVITRGIVLQYSIFLFGVLFPVFFFCRSTKSERSRLTGSTG